MWLTDCLYYLNSVGIEMLPEFWRRALLCKLACTVLKCCLTALRQCLEKGFWRTCRVWLAIPSVDQIAPACVSAACVWLVCLPPNNAGHFWTEPAWSGLLLDLWLLAWSTAWEPGCPIMMYWLTDIENRIWPSVRWRSSTGCSICCSGCGLLCPGCLLDQRWSVLSGLIN